MDRHHTPGSANARLGSGTPAGSPKDRSWWDRLGGTKGVGIGAVVLVLIAVSALYLLYPREIRAPLPSDEALAAAEAAGRAMGADLSPALERANRTVQGDGA